MTDLRIIKNKGNKYKFIYKLKKSLLTGNAKYGLCLMPTMGNLKSPTF